MPRMSAEIEMEVSGLGNHSDRDRFLQNRQNVVIAAPGMHAMKFDDEESGNMAFCRICFECDVEKDDALISPCMCKGTQQFVHRSCLDHWRSVKEGFAFSHCTTCKAQFHLDVVELKGISWPKIKFRLFVARDVFLIFLAIQMVTALMGGIAYFVDKDGSFKISLIDNWNRVMSMQPIPFYYCIGVLCFFVLVGFFGMVVHCLECSNNPFVAGCQNFCFGCGLLDCFPTSMEVWVILVIILLVIFFLLGFAYGFLVATMAIQRILQRHYHILTKKQLTREFVVRDLHGCYTPAELAPEHVNRLIMLKLM